MVLVNYDPSRDDYLVVSMSYEDTSFSDNSSHLECFSFRDNIWKEIEDPHFPFMDASDDDARIGFLFNGAIHWLVYCYDLTVNIIVAFDLMEKKLLEIRLPADHDTIRTNCGLWAVWRISKSVGVQ
jgi:hypothetical protein